MKKIFFSLVLSLAVLVVGGFVGAGTADAQVATYPSGCASWLGYSVNNGAPCNGTNNATDNPMQGCSSALGFSITNGSPCSGGTVAIDHLDGCSNIYGFSTINGDPCNGTMNVSYAPGVYPIYLPTTGDGGNASVNIALLVSSGLVAIIGGLYLARKPKVV